MISMKTQYLVVLQRSANNYGAYSPDVLGCIATGTTVEDTIAAFKSALTLHLEGLVADGEQLPAPKGIAYHCSQTEPIAEAADLLTFVEIDVDTVLASTAQTATEV